MAKKSQYCCKECGYVSVGWVGRCPYCGSWNSMQEVKIEKEKNKGLKAGRAADPLEPARPLAKVSLKEIKRIDSEMPELNRVLGGGLVPDSVTMLTARPGAGKSTLLLQLSGNLAKKGFKVLYASGEESSSQIRMRADRILDNLSENLYIMSSSDMDNILHEADRLEIDLLIVDSVQTMALREFSQRPGSPTQTVQVTAAVIEACKSSDRMMAAFLVGHVTKDESMAGLRTLEHQVDTVLYLDTGLSDQLRLLRTSKNRFGYTDEVGLFQMTSSGLIDIDDPYEIFLTRRKKAVAGSAVSLQQEGSRLIPVEVEALVSVSHDPYPMRIGDSISRDKLNTLISILEERAAYNLGNSNVVLKVTGGLALHEKVSELCILAAIASSATNKPLEGEAAFLAEVGLTGELKRASEMPRRLRELARLGFKKAYVATEYKNMGRSDQADIEIIACENLKEVLAKAFN